MLRACACHTGESTSQRFARDNTVAVLLNLDSSSPNANTATSADKYLSLLPSCEVSNL